MQDFSVCFQRSSLFFKTMFYLRLLRDESWWPTYLGILGRGWLVGVMRAGRAWAWHVGVPPMGCVVFASRSLVALSDHVAIGRATCGAGSSGIMGAVLQPLGKGNECVIQWGRLLTTRALVCISCVLVFKVKLDVT